MIGALYEWAVIRVTWWVEVVEEGGGVLLKTQGQLPLITIPSAASLSEPGVCV